MTDYTLEHSTDPPDEMESMVFGIQESLTSSENTSQEPQLTQPVSLPLTYGMPKIPTTPLEHTSDFLDEMESTIWGSEQSIQSSKKILHKPQTTLPSELQGETSTAKIPTTPLEHTSDFLDEMKSTIWGSEESIQSSKIISQKPQTTLLSGLQVETGTAKTPTTNDLTKVQLEYTRISDQSAVSNSPDATGLVDQTEITSDSEISGLAGQFTTSGQGDFLGEEGERTYLRRIEDESKPPEVIDRISVGTGKTCNTQEEINQGWFNTCTCVYYCFNYNTDVKRDYKPDKIEP